MDKTCYKCHTMKSAEDFYPHPGMKDGRLNKCKACAIQDERLRRRTKPSVQEYDRTRGNRSKDPNAWRRADPRRSKCHKAVYNALQKGALIRQPCEACGATNVVAHHEDYDKPLDIRWLCQLCHLRHHNPL